MFDNTMDTGKGHKSGSSARLFATGLLFGFNISGGLLCEQQKAGVSAGPMFHGFCEKMGPSGHLSTNTGRRSALCSTYLCETCLRILFLFMILGSGLRMTKGGAV